MKTSEFREITVQRFLFLSDLFPNLYLNLKKERNVKNMILDLGFSGKLNFQDFREVIETIDIIGEQTCYTPQILYLFHGTEIHSVDYNKIAPYLRYQVRFIHNENSF